MTYPHLTLDELVMIANYVKKSIGCSNHSETKTLKKQVANKHLDALSLNILRIKFLSKMRSIPLKMTPLWDRSVRMQSSP